MAINCTKCGEPLLGAVNRCWKCGQTVTQREVPLEAIVLDDTPAAPLPPSSPFRASVATTAERVDAQRAAQTALGGAAGAFILGLFSLPVAWVRPEGALIAILGFALGVWGLYSPARRWALVALLLCTLGIGLAAFNGAMRIRQQVQKSRPLQID